MKIKIKDLRVCKAYWRFVKENGTQLPEEPTTSKGYCDALNEMLESRYKERFSGNRNGALEDFKILKSKMDNIISSTLIPTTELDWISNGEDRIRYWIWISCRLATAKQSKCSYQLGTTGLHLEPTENCLGRIYADLNLNISPKDSTEMNQLIIDFLDLSKTQLAKKTQLVKFWKNEWRKVSNIERFSWVQENDHTQSQWLWNYITNNSETKLPTWFLPEPTTAKQKSSATIAAFDIWPAHPDTKRVFVQKMKKAWGQKKHRMKMDKTNRKAYSITMGTDAKSKLDEMALAAIMNKNDFLESIILKEYRNFITKNKP